MDDTDDRVPLKVREAAIEAKCHPKTISIAVRRGELLGYQRVVNGTWRIYRDDLHRWIRGEKPRRRRSTSRSSSSKQQRAA